MTPRHAVFISLLAAVSWALPLPAPANVVPDLSMSLGEAPLDLDVLLDYDVRRLQSAEQMRQAVDALEGGLRDNADLASVLSLAPQVLKATPNDARMRRVFATVLAATGDVGGAQRQLGLALGDAGAVWAALADAIIARQAGDLGAAQRSVDGALALEPGNAYAHNLAGTIAATGGNLTSAIDAFGEAAALAPDSATYQTNLGAARLGAGEIGAAVAALDKAVQLSPEDCRVRTLRAGAWTQQARHTAAAAELEACLQAEPRNSEAAAGLMSSLLAIPDVETAEKALVVYGGSFADTALWRAELALRRGDAAGAFEAIDAAALPPGETAILRAYANLIDGNAAEAHADAAMALELTASPSPDLHRAVLSTAIAAGEPLDLSPRTPAEHFFAALSAPDADAAAHIEAAGEFIPGFTGDGLDLSALADSEARPALAAGTEMILRRLASPAVASLAPLAKDGAAAPLALYLTGVAARLGGNTDEAVGFFEAAVAAEPNFRAPRLELAEALIAAGDAEAARAQYLAAAELRTSPAIELRIGILSESLGDTETARQAYESLLEQAPDNYAANNQLAWFLVTTSGDLDRALGLALRADELQPGNASIADTIGWVYYLRGDLDDAAAELEEAFQISGGTVPAIRYHLAKVEFDRGNTGRSKELLAPLTPTGTPGDLAAEVAELRNQVEETQ